MNREHSYHEIGSDLSLGGQIPTGRVRVGVDLIQVARIKDLLERYGDRFIHRVFTAHESDYCRDRPERLAARYAAKEAVSKALGTGIGPVSWKEIEVTHSERGEPELILRGKAAELAAQLDLHAWALSLSHTQDQAVAFVIGYS